MVERVTGSARLGDYMTENIWKPLSMTSTTFRPAERPDIAGQHCGITMRLPTGDLLANPPIPYPVKEPKDDLGGSGAYATAPDYLKLLSSLVKNDGKLLKPETVNEMFKPQLENPAYLMGILAIPEFTKYLAPGMPVGLKWNYGLGGIIAMEEISGRAGKGTMFWGGFPNLYWVRLCSLCNFL
jgi:CubicO group peptidase (beta-lactamase class C family)